MSNVSEKTVKNTSLVPGGAVNKNVMLSTLIGKLGVSNVRLNEDKVKRLPTRERKQRLLKSMQKERNNVRPWRNFTTNIMSLTDLGLLIKIINSPKYQEAEGKMMIVMTRSGAKGFLLTPVGARSLTR